MHTSTNSAVLHKESYETTFGAGLLIWKDGLLLSHRLPGYQSREAPDGGGGDVMNNEARGDKGKSSLAIDLERYFAGHRTGFEVEKLIDKTEWSDFAVAVAAALAQVPYGRCLSYSQLAMKAGYPRAYRAAGSSLARNPYPVILPCHRIIRADGSLGDYSSGEGWKRKLLDIEGISLQVG